MTSTPYNTRLCSHASPMTHCPSKSRLAHLSSGYKAYNPHDVRTHSPYGREMPILWSPWSTTATMCHCVTTHDDLDCIQHSIMLPRKSNGPQTLEIAVGLLIYSYDGYTHTHPMAMGAYLTLSVEHNGKDVSSVHAKHSVINSCRYL